LFIALIFAVVAGIVYLGGLFLECEYPFWPTLLLAARAKTPEGSRVTDLIRVRSGSSYAQQHWHHCTWCDVVYPHAPQLAIKVTVNTNTGDYFLFDWDLRQMRLLPITVRTAKLFPELITPGDTVEPLGVGLNPQLYRNDEPCLIVTQSSKK